MRVSLTKLKAWPGRVRKGALMDPSYHKWGEESYRTTEERNVRIMAVLSWFLLYIDAGRHWRPWILLCCPVGICWYWFTLYVPQRDEVLLLAVVRSMPPEFDQYVSQVLSFVSLFCLGQEKKKLQCLKNICKEQSVKLRAWSEVRVWQSDAISTLSLTNYGHLKHILVYIFFFSCSGCTYRKEKRKAINWPLTCCICLKVMKEPIMKLSVEYFWGSNKGGSVDNVAALPK